MIASTASLTKTSLAMNAGDLHAGLSSLFAAAVVSRSFCSMLLSNPEQALKQGYMGRTFPLSAEVASLIVSLNAKSLKDLAQQVVQTIGQ
jgi:hypothetical protein